MLKSIQRRQPGDLQTLEQAPLHPLLARVYSARGIAAPAELDLGLANLLPPSSLRNADLAAVGQQVVALQISLSANLHGGGQVNH